MTVQTEIAPGLFRFSTFVAPYNLQFNQFLSVDEEPLLFHTGLRHHFPAVRQAVSELIDPTTVRWLAFSHYEADECGSLNEWLDLAPQAEAVCSRLGKLVSIDDVTSRPARGMEDGEVLQTGAHRFRFLRTPHVPHAWEAGLMFEETSGVLLASDIFHQDGDVAPIIESGVVERAKATLLSYQGGLFDNYLPYTAKTVAIIHRLADLQPKVVCTMHGSTYAGDGGTALRDYARMLREVMTAQ